MRGLAIVFVCLWVVVKSIHNEEMTISVCEVDQCACKPSQKPSPFTEVYKEDLGCYCFCGVEKSENCREDFDCVQGLHCAAGHQKGGHGQCEDACKKPGFSCSIYDKCRIGDDGEPMCVCKIWNCTKEELGHVCAFDPIQNKQVTFNNVCLFINADCKLRMAGQEGLEYLPSHECAAVIQHNQQPGTRFDGFQFESLI